LSFSTSTQKFSGKIPLLYVLYQVKLPLIITNVSNPNIFVEMSPYIIIIIIIIIAAIKLHYLRLRKTRKREKNKNLEASDWRKEMENDSCVARENQIHFHRDSCAADWVEANN
jgi:hypothetical protein